MSIGSLSSGRATAQSLPNIGTSAPHAVPAKFPNTLLRSRVTWWLLGTWALCFGLFTWAIEAFLLRVVPGAPHEPLGGVFRVVQSFLWIVALVLVIGMAERWPIQDVWRQRRRVVWQLCAGLLLGPWWGTTAYRLSARLMPAWHTRGMWGLIATEAKGAFFGYCVTVTLVNAVMRTLLQRQRELEAAHAVRDAAEARLNLLKLEMQPERVLGAMTAVEELIPQDVTAANEALVLLAEMLHQLTVSARAQFVTLAEELSVTEMFVQLRQLSGRRAIELSSVVDDEIRDAEVPHLLLQTIVDELIGNPAVRESDHLRLRVVARADHGQLALRLSGEGTESRADIRAGAGLSRVRERLVALYEEAFTLSVNVERPDATSIDVRLPFRQPS